MADLKVDSVADSANSGSVAFPFGLSSPVGVYGSSPSDPMVVPNGIQGVGAPNSNAASGVVGEKMEIIVSTPVTIVSSAAFQDLGTVTLTDGDWDICASFIISRNGAALGTGGNGVDIRVGWDNVASPSQNLFTPFTAQLLDKQSTTQNFWTLTTPVLRVQVDGTDLTYGGSVFSGSAAIYAKVYLEQILSGSPQAGCYLLARRVR